MKMLETNDWMILNNIIYKLYTTEDGWTMRRQLLEQMKMVLDFDSADFYLVADKERSRLTEPVMYNCVENPDIPACYEERYCNRGSIGKSSVYRETDIIPDKARVESKYYKKIFCPNNWHYSLQLVLGREGECLGVITFYRIIGKDNFQYNDIFLLDMLKDHLSYRLYRDRWENGKSSEKLTIGEAAEEYGLTRREHMILGLLMQGKDNRQLCNELSITVNTLKKHILNIYRKLGIRNRVQMFKMIQEKE